MKSYEILDEENRMCVGTLLYYEKEGSVIIELEKNLDEWTAPLLFTSFVKKNIYTIPKEISFLWVKERVIPSGRQNIGSILDNHKLKVYDEMDFLEISQGKCSQDSLYVKRIDKIPHYVAERARHNVSECFITYDRQILCFFADDTVKKIDISTLKDEDIDKVLKHPAVFESLKVGTGGYSITFNDSYDISARLLYTSGVSIPLSAKDFISFINRNIVDTSGACDILKCSRQNLSYLVKEEILTPIKKNFKGNLYTKGELYKNKW